MKKLYQQHFRSGLYRILRLSGDYVVMVTDGVLDALPAKEQEEQMIDIIQNTNIVNPTEFARSILSEVLKYSGEMPLDDMTILVIGLWGVS